MTPTTERIIVFEIDRDHWGWAIEKDGRIVASSSSYPTYQVAMKEAEANVQ